jgi:nucleoside-diphosphate-sugar epimerase
VVRVLVTGDRGYLGSQVSAVLERSAGCDLGLFDTAGVAGPARDFRDLTAADLSGADAVVHLAAVPNDAAGDISPDATEDVNHRGSVRLARLARDAGVRSFVLASSCSVYGAAGDVAADESYSPTPLTAYGSSKLAAEAGVLALAGPGFRPVALRFATLYGYSPSFRSDLMVNRMVSTAWRTGKIHVSGTGAALRPMLHVRDAASAIAAVLPVDLAGQLFNVGAVGRNRTVLDIARLVAEAFPDAVIEPAGVDDARSYTVDFARFARTLPDWRPRLEIADGVRDVADALRDGDLPQLTSAASGWATTDRREWLLRLRGRGVLDEQFRLAGGTGSP